MTRVGWCPGGRTVADMLALYPDTPVVRIFVGPGKPLPAWDGPILGPAVAAGAVVHLSFKTPDWPAVRQLVDAKPAGLLLFLTFGHEPEQGVAEGDLPIDEWRAGWVDLVALLADHPKRDQLLLVPVYTRYWWQKNAGDLRWLITDGVDAIGWDVYNNGVTYRTPDDLLSIPRAIAAQTGLPYLLAEVGALRLLADTDGSGRQAWMRAMVAAARADGALTVCWYHKYGWDLAAAGSEPEQQTWRDLIEQEARMGRWTDLATWVGPTPNQSGPMNRWDGVVLHIAAGTYDGTIAWQKNPDADVSSHFIVAEDGRIAQMVDTGVTAWTQRAGNGEWLSVENAGYLPNPLTGAQVEANARILAKAHLVYGVPLQVTNTPDTRGLGHHSMGAENGYDWGHPACPGDAIKAQKAAIVARAIQIINGEDDMPTIEEIQRAVELGVHAALTKAVARTDSYGRQVGDAIAKLQAPVVAAVAREASNPDEVRALLAELPQAEAVDEQAIVAGVLAGIDPATLAERIAAAMPADQARQVADELAARLTS